MEVSDILEKSKIDILCEYIKNYIHEDIAKDFYKLTDAQINMFGNQLSRLPELSYLAVGNESYEALASKIKEMLRDPTQQKQFIPHLKNLGFKP